MKTCLTSCVVLIALLPLAGCASQYLEANEGVTGGAGNAVAANAVKQMVDPWPAKVEDTTLLLAPATKAAATEGGAQ